MLKNISNLGKALTKEEQKIIFGGKESLVEKCCIRIPTHEFNGDNWCNPNPECSSSSCAC